MAYRGCYLDLDPTYRDAYGTPLLRMTLNWQDNDMRVSEFLGGSCRRSQGNGREIHVRPCAEAGRQLGHAPLPKHPYQRRDSDGRRSQDERRQQIPPELGRAEFVRARRQRLCARDRLQPDRPRGPARLLGGGEYPLDVLSKTPARGSAINGAVFGAPLLGGRCPGARRGRLWPSWSSPCMFPIRESPLSSRSGSQTWSTANMSPCSATAPPATRPWAGSRSPVAYPSRHAVGTVYSTNITPDHIPASVTASRIATCSCKPMARDLPSSLTPLAAAH